MRQNGVRQPHLQSNLDNQYGARNQRQNNRISQKTLRIRAVKMRLDIFGRQNFDIFAFWNENLQMFRRSIVWRHRHFVFRNSNRNIVTFTFSPLAKFATPFSTQRQQRCCFFWEKFQQQHNINQNKVAPDSGKMPKSTTLI